MYKSTFAKYFTAFVLILGISIIMLSSIFAALIREYTADDSDERLRKTSASVAEILNPPGHGIKNLAAVVETRRDLINGMVKISTDQNIIVCDNAGVILFSTISGTDVRQIDLSSFDSYSDDSGNVFLFSVITLEKSGTEKHRAYAKTLISEEETVGYVLALKSTAKEDAIIGVTRRAVITGSLWMMLAALIAVLRATADPLC